MEDLIIPTSIKDTLYNLIGTNGSLPITEIQCLSKEELAHKLCGTANAHLAHSFMKGMCSEAFLNNVRYNSESSIPFIIRIIQIRLSES